MTSRERHLFYWLALARAPALGHFQRRRLLERFSTPAAVFSASSRQLADFPLTREARAWLGAPDVASIEADLRWLAEPGNHVLTWADDIYPSLLRRAACPPVVLYVHGDPEVLQTPQLAVVGSRNPTAGGATTAWEFSRSLAGCGITVTSGLALGVDAAAHEGALSGGGLTVAVAGTGLDRVYPVRHRELAHRIAAEGALVSEFPVGVGPRRQHFPQRNRLIAGLSMGTLVVEATVKSGSLITAQAAAREGREVFAVPGSIHNPLARGCHSLIRQGAKLVESAPDVLEELPHLVSAASFPSSADPRASAETLSREQADLLRAVGYDPVSMDLVVSRSGLTAEAVSSMLLFLELEGYVSSAPGGRFCRTGKA